MSAVPVFQALFWPGDSPVSRTGEVDFKAVAQGLARAEYRGPSCGEAAFGLVGAPGIGYALREGAVPGMGVAVRKGYSRAQHAVVASRAVDTLAALKMAQRHVLAMHAWLAGLRETELNSETVQTGRGARKRLALRFMELEALADVLARTTRWNNPVEGSFIADALATSRLLVRLAGLEAGERNRIALYALFSELPPAGLSTAAADAAMRRAGLEVDAPKWWVNVLRLARRMADETVRRDVRTGPGIERTGFPALETKIQPLDESAAARLWLERYRVLSEAGSRTTGEHGTGETN